MKPVYKAILTIVVIVMSILISSSIFLLPSVKPVTANATEFSADRAIQHVEMIAKNVHPIGSPEQKKARDYIVNTLEGLSLKPEIQKGHVENTVEGFMGYVPYTGDAENIYARLKGTGNTGQTILMLAHYDSTLGGPGAADDASGVAVLLETARALLSDKPLVNDILFLFTDGEEAELLGSKLFAGEETLRKDVSLVINLEARGNRGPSILFETSDGNRWLMEEFKEAVPDPVAYSLTFDVYKMVTNVTDFTSFLNAGKSGFNLANLGGYDTYHFPEDTAENLSRKFLQHQGNYALSLAGHFGAIPLDNVKSENNAVYFTLAKGLMVLYPEQLNFPFTILALILFAGALFLAFRKQFVSLKGVISGFLVSLLTTVVAAVFGISAQLLFTKLYFKLEEVYNLSQLISLKRTIVLHGYVWIVITSLLALFVLMIITRLFIRKVKGYSLFVGNCITWTILTVFAAFYLPGAQYMFLWPLIFSLIGLVADFVRGNRHVSKNLILFTFSVFSCVLIYFPVGYLLFQALMMQGAGIPILVLSLPAELTLISTLLFVGRDKEVAVLIKRIAA